MTTHAQVVAGTIVPKSPARSPARISRILVGVDFSHVSECALRRGVDLAEQLGASLVVCHVLPLDAPIYDLPLGMAAPTMSPEEATDIACRATEELVSRYASDNMELTSVVRRGDAATEIAAAARDANADLVIVGTRARTGVARILLGDVAELVVRSTNLPVMLLHDPLDDAS
jgi:nucleotide-binding universal stress UspA family protein